MSKKLYGFFSQKMKRAGANYCYDADRNKIKTPKSVIYKTPDGNEVEVTCVSEDPSGAVARWDDKIFVGEVVPFGIVRRIYL